VVDAPLTPTAGRGSNVRALIASWPTARPQLS
jgi:hypothetical protein